MRILGKRRFSPFFLLFFVLCSTGGWPLRAQIAPTRASTQMNLLKEIVEIEAKELSFERFFELLNTKLSSPLYISYHVEDLNSKVKVTLPKCRKTVEEILREVLSKHSLTYTVKNNIVIIDRMEQLQQQDVIMVKGKVVEKETGHPIAGATVSVKGSSKGTFTDKDGVFSITVKPGSVLIVSFIGKTSQNVRVVSAEPLVVKLAEEQVEMEEVVVTGYTNIDKNTFTGNVKIIKNEELMKVSRTDVLKAISSFDPSFRIAENNIFGSDPNALPEISIRGHSSMGVMQLDKDKFSKASLEKNPNTPTFIMDGFEVSIQKICDMDLNRIESVTILKDAAATAMYGSRAANGVVVITTKAPKEGKVRVSYNFTSTVEIPDLRDYNLMNSKEKLEAERLAEIFEPIENGDPYRGDHMYWKKYNAVYVEGVETDWMSLPLRNAFQNRHSMNVESGNDKIRYNFDLSYSNDKGVMKGSERNNVGAGFNVYITIGKLLISNMVSYNNTHSKESPYGSFGDYTHQLPYNKYKDEKGELLTELETWGSGSIMPNPMYEATLGNFDKEKRDELINNLQLRFDLGKGFMLQGFLGLAKSWSERNRFIDPKSRKSSMELSGDNLLAGDLFTTDGNSDSWNCRLGMSYNSNMGRSNINFSIIGEINQKSSYSLSTHYVGFATGTSADINYASQVKDKPAKQEHLSRYAGLNGIFNYSFDNIYLADLSVRYEGSSIFGKDQQTTPYWSGGLGLNIHNYEFLKASDLISRLKVRASYGEVGNVNFEPHMSHNYFKALFDDWYITGYGSNLYYMGNPDLKSEKTNTFDISADVSLLNDRLNMTATYYNKKTTDMINDVTTPSSAGFRSYKDNIGKIRNRGVELSVYATVVNRKDWFCSIYGNFARNKEVLLKIAESLKRYNERVNAKYENYDIFPDNQEYADVFTKYEEGGSTTVFYGMKSLGIDPATGKEVFVDRSGNVTYDYLPSQQVIIGNTEPKGQGTFGFNTRYKNFTLSSVFRYEFGSDRYNETLVNYVENADIAYSNVDRRVLTQRWQVPGDETALKDIRERRRTTRATSRFVQKYNLLSLTSLTLQYEFDEKISRALHLERLRIEANTGELFRFCSVKQERGLSYPFAKNFNFTLMVNF